jgi:hypothetical protein
LEIEVARIKLAAEPVERLLVFFVLGIFDSLQEFVVAPDAATIFRRTSVRSIQANRMLRFRVSGQGPPPAATLYFLTYTIARIGE